MDHSEGSSLSDFLSSGFVRLASDHKLQVRGVMCDREMMISLCIYGIVAVMASRSIAIAVLLYVGVCMVVFTVWEEEWNDD